MVSFGYLIVTNNAMWGRAMWASRLGKRKVGVKTCGFMIFEFLTIVLISGVCRQLGGHIVQ